MVTICFGTQFQVPYELKRFAGMRADPFQTTKQESGHSPRANFFYKLSDSYPVEGREIALSASKIVTMCAKICRDAEGITLY
jgi:hypothetical protein